MHPIRTIPGRPSSLYLTFDDGPAPGSTEAVLDLLGHEGVRATFFVVAERGAKERALLRRIVESGHRIGNHSLDHRYGNYFLGRRKMIEWVRCSEELLADLTGAPTVGFRPPAGVRTPELHRALHELDLPLILWSERFFDSTWGFTERQARASATRVQPGSIVLLHDRQKKRNMFGFLEALNTYTTLLRARGWTLDPLDRTLYSDK